MAGCKMKCTHIGCIDSACDIIIDHFDLVSRELQQISMLMSLYQSVNGNTVNDQTMIVCLVGDCLKLQNMVILNRYIDALYTKEKCQLHKWQSTCLKLCIIFSLLQCFYEHVAMSNFRIPG